MNNFSITDLELKFPDISDLQYIAEGGQKIVLKGIHQEYGDIVLKLASGIDDRTLREIEIVTSRSLLGVPHIFESGAVDLSNNEFLFIIETQIVGTTLREKLISSSTLSIEKSLTLLEFLLETVASLESQNLVHRDIKPENIMISDDGNYFLIDFGIARDLSRTSLTDTASPYGPATIGYAALEQFRNIKAEIDSRADLFSIGVVIYECITGSNPYYDNARSQLDILRSLESLNIPQLSFDINLGGFIKSLMERWPSRRPNSAAEALTWYRDIN